MSARLASRLTLVAAAAGLASCAVGPNYHRPPLPPAASYGGEQALSGEAAPTSGPQLIPGGEVGADWWRVFGSDDLDALVDRALKNSPTVDAAKAALRSAAEQVKAQRGAYYPSVEASIAPSRQGFAETLASPTASGISLYTLTTTQVSVSYTPDLFGANRRAVESLVAQQDAQRFELEAARITLASNVATAAIQDASLRAQIEATDKIIANQRAVMASFERQFQLGQASKADLAAQQALLAQSEATRPPLVKAYEVNRDLLAALLGQTPGEPLDDRFDLASMKLPESLPLSVPARLVDQRPDVRIAEAQLHSAGAEVGVAEAARLPNLQITGAAGSATLGLGVSLSPQATFWNIAATLTQPIFEGGTLLHRQRAAEATYDQAAAQYRATVVGAFQNTADVLHALSTDADAATAAQKAQDAADRSLDIARRQLALGDISRLAMLSAEQADAQAKIASVQAEANRYSDVVALFVALGGGWWNKSATTP